MAYPDDITDDDALVKPRSLSLEDVTGQPSAAVTGIKSVVPFRAAGWSNKNPDGTPKQSLWDPDAPTPSIERLKNKIGSLWNGGNVMDSIQRGADKALGQTGGAAAPLGINDQPSEVGGEAAPMGITDLPGKPKPIEKLADGFDPKNPATAAPKGSLADHITEAPPDPNTPPPSALPPVKDSAAIPPKAAPAQQQTRAGLFGVPGLLGELGSNIHNWTDQRRMMLMALAGGLAGQGNLSQRLGAGFTNAAAAMPEQQKLNNQNATQNFFMSPKGGSMSPDLARAVASNPALMQETLGQMTGISPPKTQTINTPMGSYMVQWNPSTKTWDKVSAGAGSGGNLPDNWETLDPQAKLKALDPTTRGMVQTVLAGGAVPPARMAFIMGLAKEIDPTFTETDYHANKQLATDLEKNNPNSNGGNLLKGLSSFEHVADWAHSAAEVGGWSGPDLPGGSMIGSGAMVARRLSADPALTTKLNTEFNQAMHAGQEMTNYYSASGGGEGERTSIVKRSTGWGVTPADKAGAIYGEAQLAKAKIEQQLTKILSNPAGKRFFERPENQELLRRFQTNLNNIDTALNRLDPNGAAGRVGNAAVAAQQAPMTQRAPATQGAGDPLAQARAAIAAGANREAVIQRLRQAGVNPQGL